MVEKKGNILIIDDNIQILDSLKILLRKEFGFIDTIKNPNQIQDCLWRNDYDVILLDMNFAKGARTGNEGIFWMNEILKIDIDAVIILITAYAEIDLAVKAMKEGATDFVSKPWDAEKLIATLKSAYSLRQSKIEIKRLKNQNRQILQDAEFDQKILWGSSNPMKTLYATMRKVAATDANVLILGENGTGKELVAKEIHKLSKRKNEIFAGVDIGSLSESLFESEMFGHTKGAFTDAKEDRVGRFENAHKGTLFLDEIGNLSLSLQAKLLQAIQNKTINRVGSNKPIPVDIRLISATNKHLDSMVKQNTFREDLYYRLNTIILNVPSLRERTEDIPILAEFFLKEYSGKYEKPFLKFNTKALEIMASYHWPGNIRELKHTIEKSVILAESNIITEQNLFLQELANPSLEEKNNLVSLEEIEKRGIKKILDECRGNYTKAASILNISRTTLYAKMKKYELQ